MSDLMSLVAGYLTADGYIVQQRDRAREVIGERPGPARTRERIYVWVPEVTSGQSFRNQEGPYLERFRRANESHPSASKMLVVPSLNGLSTDFRSQAYRTHRVGVRVPVQFFDTEFKWEHDDTLASTARSIKVAGGKVDATRTEQPFTASGRYAGEGSDLVSELFSRFHGYPRQTGIHIVQGPAGIGKSFLFSSLYARLHDAFLTDKRDQRTSWARPLPLVPEYDPGQQRLNGLLTVFMQTELERLIPPSLFHWMLANGQSLWMLDGLEEIMARDDEFSQIILDSFTQPNVEGVPTILICLRDSLMNTNSSIKEFCSEYEDYTTVYTLKRWQQPSITAFAGQAVTEGKSREFVRGISSSTELSDLASLPYYCKLLADEFNERGFRDSHSAESLIENALVGMIRREYEKGLALTEKVLPIDDVLTFAQDIAQKDMQSGFNGITVNTISDWAEDWADLVLQDPDERDRFIFQMSQMALFSQDPSTRRLRFAQEILEQFLLGRLYVNYLRNNQKARFLDEFNFWEFPEESITLHMLAGFFVERDSGESEVQILAMDALHKPTAFKNILQLISIAGFEASFLHLVAVGKDLSNLRLRNVDLTGVSFSACDLSNTEFHACTLCETDFSGAIVNNTGFFDVNNDLMEGASFGDMSRFHSMRVGRSRVIARTPEAQRWWYQMASRPDEVTELPCGAAEQLRTLFRKFVYPNGQGRRDEVQEVHLNRGQRHVLKPSEITDAAIKHGYLTRSSPGKFRRADGTMYSEMVESVKDLVLSDDLRFLLDNVCEVDGCAHVEA